MTIRAWMSFLCECILDTSRASFNTYMEIFLEHGMRVYLFRYLAPRIAMRFSDGFVFLLVGIGRSVNASPFLNSQSRTCSFCLISLSRLFLWKSTYSMRCSAAILDCFAGGFCVCPPSSWIERHFKCQGCLVPFVFSWALLSISFTRIRQTSLLWCEYVRTSKRITRTNRKTT